MNTPTQLGKCLYLTKEFGGQRCQYRYIYPRQWNDALKGPLCNKSSSNASAFNLTGRFVNRRLHRAGVDVVHKTSWNLLAGPTLFFPPHLTSILLPLQKVQLQALASFALMDSECYSGLRGEKGVEICFHHFLVEQRQKVPLALVPDQYLRETLRTFIWLNHEEETVPIKKTRWYSCCCPLQRLLLLLLLHTSGWFRLANQPNVQARAPGENLGHKRTKTWHIKGAENNE